MPIADLLRKLPASPGVYQFFDADGQLLYIGKAKRLKNRVKSYFQAGERGPRTAKLVEKIADLKWLETATEAEALALEANLVKEHQPKFNVLLRDDKNFLYFKVTLGEEFPRVLLTRRVERDGAKYFGPQTDATAAHATLKLLQKLFQLRVCNLEMAEQPDGKVIVTRATQPYPCLYKQIKLCTAPCDSSTSRAAYDSQVRGVLAFLAGDTAAVLRDLQTQMATAAAERQFERAARLRDSVAALTAIAEKQRVTDPMLASRDILGLEIAGTRAYLAVLTVRDGRLIDQKNFTLAAAEADADEILTAFLTQFYGVAEDLPREILLPNELPEQAALAEFLAQKAGRKVALLVPERGQKAGLLTLAAKNAAAYAVQQRARFENATARTVGAAAELATALGLDSKLARIECYDISHLGGTATTGSLVVFENGEPANAAYRQFKIRALKSGEVDDYKSMAEVLRRRLSYLVPQLPSGLTLRRATKKDAPQLESVRWRDFATGEICDDLRDYLVAVTADGTVVGRVKLHFFPAEKVWGLYGLWVDDAWRGHRLGHTLVRKILALAKPPKVYLNCVPELVEYYGELGFREARQVPEFLRQNLATFSAQNPDRSEEIRATTFLVWNARTQEIDPSFATVPDLIVLDGGKGQLSAVLGAVTLPKKTAVIGLAKREEEIFKIKNAKVKMQNKWEFEKVVLPAHAPALQLLTRLRDEAHRTANDLRKKVLKKELLTTSLDEIAGLGPAARKKLLQKLGSPAAVRAASLADLAAVVGPVLAEKIVNWAAAAADVAVGETDAAE